jgi:hypothetical protein
MGTSNADEGFEKPNLSENSCSGNVRAVFSSDTENGLKF